MRVHSLQKIKEIKVLRSSGYSINEIVDKLSVPKTTVWHHIKGVKVLPEHVLLLKAKQGGSRKRKENNLQIAAEKAEKLLQNGDIHLGVVLAMLYWAEGSKKVCEFINSDGKMIQVYLGILRNYLDISDECLKITVRYFTGMNKDECLSYWSKTTGISRDKFIVRYNDGGTRGKTRYGMCRITVKRGQNTLKLIHSLISKTSDRILNSIN